MLPDTLEPSLPEVSLGLPGGLGQPGPPTVSSSLLGSILRLSPGVLAGVWGERLGKVETCSGSAIRCIAGCCYCWGAGVLYRERPAMSRKQLERHTDP